MSDYEYEEDYNYAEEDGGDANEEDVGLTVELEFD